MTRARTAALTTLAGVGAVGLAAAGWGFGVEPRLFAVRRHTLALLPAGSPSITVLHVSDPHMAPWQHRKQRWIAHLAEQVQPDLVINTGDNLGHRDGLEGIRRAYAPLKGVPGVFVHGSNDRVEPTPRNPLLYFSGPSTLRSIPQNLDTPAMDDFFINDLGWSDLNNRAAQLRAAGAPLTFFGVSDAHRDWDDLDALPAALTALRPRTTPALTIGVTHAPYRRILDRFIDLGAQMIFAGHTHGGQVRIPFSRSAIVANCDILLDQARGLSTWTSDGRSVPLNVSAGLGASIYAPVRMGCRPEASVLTLRAAR